MKFSLKFSNKFLIKQVKNVLILGVLLISYQNCSSSLGVITPLSSSNSNNTSVASSSPQNNISNSLESKSAPSFPDLSQWPPKFQALPTSACAGALIGSHSTYNVGPGQDYSELTAVPWLKLVAGDVVNIYYRNTPYRTKFGLRVMGTKNAPFIINGVTDANCNRPELSGINAVTADDSKQANFSSDTQSDALISIWRSPTDDISLYKAKYIIIQNLKISGVKEGNSYFDNSGTAQVFSSFAAAIYAHRVDYLLVENCELSNNSQGVFTNSAGSYDSISTNVDYSSYVVLRRNLIFSNGNSGSPFEHGVYMQAKRSLFEGNYFGQNVSGALGVPLKDRSSGTIIRYNYIINSNRALDLVESEEEYTTNVPGDILYNHAWVYGNMILTDDSLPNFNRRIIHFGYDNNVDRARKNLHFYNNTVISKIHYGDGKQFMGMFGIGINANSTVDVKDNIFYNPYSDSTPFNFLDETGTINLVGTNILPISWSLISNLAGGTSTYLNNVNTTIASNDPGLNSDYTLKSNSIALDKASVYVLTGVNGVNIDNLQVNGVFDFTNHTAILRKQNGILDVGAFEY